MCSAFRLAHLCRGSQKPYINVGASTPPEGVGLGQRLFRQVVGREVPAHFYLKRAWVLENGFGSGEEHADLISESLASEVA